ncbi:CG17770 [Drosophila busckii]|uniref:CG17770 n=1 Tax=Drosophila busckii TaxID=30019 RepID=A0A0M4EFJ8_DROBS|nr:calmodulin [Drosophila busckii]ALC46954.1 CG17770 [Drosophila busckii]
MDDFDFGTPPPEERVTIQRTHSLNAEQEKDLTEAFSLFDQEGTGVIPIKQLGELMHAVAHNPPEHEMQELFAEYDPYNTEEISLNDFLHIMSERYKEQTPEDEVILAFKVFDKEQSGFIHENELRQIMTTYGDVMDEDEVEQFILDGNSNTECKVNFAEFVMMMAER